MYNKQLPQWLVTVSCSSCADATVPSFWMPAIRSDSLEVRLWDMLETIIIARNNEWSIVNGSGLTWYVSGWQGQHSIYICKRIHTQLLHTSWMCFWQSPFFILIERRSIVEKNRDGTGSRQIARVTPFLSKRWMFLKSFSKLPTRNIYKY